VAIDQLTAPPNGSGTLSRSHRGRLLRLTDLAVLGALTWWATVLTWATGGRDRHVVSVGVALVALAALLVRPWEKLPRLVCVAAVAPGCAGFAVCILAPTGWAGADSAASWTYAGLLALVTAAWAVDERRRELLLLVLVLGPLGTFAKGWTAWWGGEDSTAPFVGTFYWHNQEAAFLMIGAVTGLVLALRGQPSTRVIGWLALALCGAGVVITTSRGTMMALALALLALIAVAVSRRAWRIAAQAVVSGLLVAATATLLTGPPFFAHRGSALGGITARSGSGETLGANSGHRLDDWSSALRVIRHWPFTGVGFHGFASASAKVSDNGRGSLTPFAHNGYLQAFVDGGALLGVTVLLALGVAVVAAARGLARARRVADWRTIGAGCTLLALLMHSGIDFDWSYPSLLSGLGLVTALASPAVGTERRRTGWGFPLLWSALVGLAVVGAWRGGMHLNVPLRGTS
jgi:O-antigen ligase